MTIVKGKQLEELISSEEHVTRRAVESWKGWPFLSTAAVFILGTSSLQEYLMIPLKPTASFKSSSFGIVYSISACSWPLSSLWHSRAGLTRVSYEYDQLSSGSSYTST